MSWILDYVEILLLVASMPNSKWFTHMNGLEWNEYNEVWLEFVHGFYLKWK